MTDRDRVLQALREAGSTGLHSTAMRRQGLTGNPSQRIAELRDRGYRIEATSKPWKDGEGKRRPGTTYTLISESDPGLGTGEAAPSDPPTAPVDDTADGEPASVEPEAEPPSLFAVPEPESGSYRDPDSWEAA